MTVKEKMLLIAEGRHDGIEYMVDQIEFGNDMSDAEFRQHVANVIVERTIRTPEQRQSDRDRITRQKQALEDLMELENYWGLD